MEFLGFLALLSMGFFVGRTLEKAHYRRIRERELSLLPIPAVSFRSLPTNETRTIEEAKLVTGSVVVSVDYFKRILALLRALVGGEVTSYASVIDRGRREAMLRMKEACPNADMFINTRIETSTLASGGANREGIAGVEFVAYGTAITYKK